MANKKDAASFDRQDMLAATELLAREGMNDVLTYFQPPGDISAEDRATAALRAQAAIKLLGHYWRGRATRANEAQALLGIARAIGLKGTALVPLWEQLTGTHLTAPTDAGKNALPTPAAKARRKAA